MRTRVVWALVAAAVVITPRWDVQAAQLADFKAPRKIKDAKPVYPQIAQQAKIQGIVIIEAIIGKDGSVKEARVLRPVPMLDQAALDAVRKWKYSPTLLNGQPVEVVMTVTVTFTLNAP